MSRCLLPITVFLSLSFAPTPSPKPAPVDDREAIQGKWRLVSGAIGDSEFKDSDDIWTFTKTHLVYESGKKDSYTLDPKKNPKQFDCVIVRDDQPKETMIGIYELKGDDLKISLTESDSPRPKKFEVSRDHNFFVLKRVTEKKK
jgi:uncharacterized protein (TIGR03067 family)